MRIIMTFSLCLIATACAPADPESCDLDTFFSTSRQNVNCVEDVADSGEFTCTCPDGSTFASSDTCAKSDSDQGDLIDSACPLPSE